MQIKNVAMYNKLLFIFDVFSPKMSYALALLKFMGVEKGLNLSFGSGISKFLTWTSVPFCS